MNEYMYVYLFLSFSLFLSISLFGYVYLILSILFFPPTITALSQRQKIHSFDLRLCPVCTVYVMHIVKRYKFGILMTYNVWLPIVT